MVKGLGFRVWGIIGTYLEGQGSRFRAEDLGWGLGKYVHERMTGNIT